MVVARRPSMSRPESRSQLRFVCSRVRTRKRVSRPSVEKRAPNYFRRALAQLHEAAAISEPSVPSNGVPS